MTGEARKYWHRRILDFVRQRVLCYKSWGETHFVISTIADWMGIA